MSRANRLQLVMRRTEISLGARFLVWELSQWIADDHDVCVRTQQQLADTLGVHRNSIIRWIHELRAHGLVTDEPVKGQCAYSLHLDKVALGST